MNMNIEPIRMCKCAKYRPVSTQIEVANGRVFYTADLKVYVCHTKQHIVYTNRLFVMHMQEYIVM